MGYIQGKGVTMILYHAVSSYQLLEVTLHKFKFNRSESCVLLITVDVVRRLPNYKDFEQFFDQIIVYNNSIGNSKVSAKHELKAYFNSVFAKHNLKIGNFKEIYACCVHHSLGIFFAQNNIPFIYLEDGVGAISKPEVLESVECRYKEKHNLCLRYGLYNATNPNIVKRIYNAKHQKKGFVCQNGENFDVVDELESFPTSERNALIHIFTKMPMIETSGNSVLLLTEHLANMMIMTWEDQIIIYQTIVDYFLKNYDLVIKPHPDDLMYYSKLFPKSKVIKDRFPAELLPFLFKTRPSCVATVSSTAIYGVQQCFEKVLQFNYDFSYKKKQFKYLHRYLAAYQYLKAVSKKNYTCHTYGVNPAISNAFEQFSNVGLEQTIIHENINDLADALPGDLWIIDVIEQAAETSEHMCNILEKLPVDVTVIFIDGNNDYPFFYPTKRKLWENIYVLGIKQNVEELNIGISDMEYCKNDIIYLFKKGKKVTMTEYTEKLKCSHSILTISDFNEQELEIKRLEGILKATEKRLLYYIHLTDTLNEQLNTIKNN